MPLTIRKALKATSSLLPYVKTGMGAMKPKDRTLVAVGERSKISDSLDLDAATADDYPQDRRWDYLISVSSANKIVGLEPHGATDAEIKVIVGKKENALVVLREHLKQGHTIAEWHWVTHGSVGFSRMDRATRALSQSGIQFHGRGLKKL